MAVSANRLELLQIADAVARDKSIDKQVVLTAMEEAMQRAAKAHYGSENDIKVDIDPRTGETHVSRYLHVVELVENDKVEISLVDARKRMFRIMYDAPETSLSPREREVMRFPMTAMMGCPICNSMRMWRDWPGFSAEPIEEDLYIHAEALDIKWSGFSAREALLLEFVDRFANAIDGINGDEVFWSRLHANFTDTEIGDIVVMSGTWLGVGHGLKALGIGSVCALPASEETLRRLRNAELDVAAT